MTSWAACISSSSSSSWSFLFWLTHIWKSSLQLTCLYLLISLELSRAVNRKISEEFVEIWRRKYRECRKWEEHPVPSRPGVWERRTALLLPPESGEPSHKRFSDTFWMSQNSSGTGKERIHYFNLQILWNTVELRGQHFRKGLNPLNTALQMSL